jgi:hypothetical protein
VVRIALYMQRLNANARTDSFTVHIGILHVDILTIILSAVAGVAAYRINHHYDSKSPLKQTELQLKQLELYKQMKELNLTNEDLQKMRDQLPVKGNSGIVEFAETMPEFQTQADMYNYVLKEFQFLREDLANLFDVITKTYDSKWVYDFKQAHDAWENYSSLQAHFIANEYKGGSLEPCLYISELNKLTKQRRTELIMFLGRDLPHIINPQLMVK